MLDEFLGDDKLFGESYDKLSSRIQKLQFFRKLIVKSPSGKTLKVYTYPETTMNTEPD